MQGEREIHIDKNLMELLERNRDRGATGPEIAKSLRDSQGVSIEEAEAALRGIGFSTARTQDEPNKISVLERTGDWYALHPRSEIIDWGEKT